MPTWGAIKVSVSFCDVVLCLSEREWERLEEWQRDMYSSVMKKIHDALISLGFGIQNPDVLFRIRNPEKVFFQDHLYSKHDDGMSDSSPGSAVCNPDLLLSVSDVGEPDVVDERDSDSCGESDSGLQEPSSVEHEDGSERVELGEEGHNLLACHNDGIIYCVSTDVNSDISSEAAVVQSNTCANPVGSVTIANVEHGILQGDGSVLCAKCGGRYSNLSDFVVHQTMHFENAQGSGNVPAQSEEDVETKLFRCSECGKSFRQNSGLLKHQRSHTGEKPYKCTQCSKRFSRSSSLCLHKRIHTGEKPYICKFCEKCFSQSSSLIKHQRTHTGERPYPCMYCDKTFTQKQHFVGHQRTHTGERPFACAECGESFNRKEMLNKHQATHKADAESQHVVLHAESQHVALHENVVHEEVISAQQPVQ